MVAKLVIEEGDLKGLTLSLEDSDSWTIGRDPDECQLVIEDPLVSRKHLLLSRTSEGMKIQNLSDTNPVQINEETIDDQPRLLQNGDAIKIGNELLRYYEESSAHILDESPDQNLSDISDSDLSDDSEITIGDEMNEEIAPKDTNAPTPENASQSPPTPDLDQPSPQNTIFREEDAEMATLADIDFGLIETGRWLLKVIGGPNNGAEFYMQSGNSYILGTDPQTCDIVFHDTSVSRQHAKITVTPDETLTIEDLKSRNGVLMGGIPIENKETLNPNTIITCGTSSFVIYDREGEMQTIISPLLPSIIKVLQQEPPKSQESPSVEETPAPAAAPMPVYDMPPPSEIPPPKPPRHLGPYFILTAVIGLFVLAGIGTTSLFHNEPIVVQTQENADELLQQAIKPFPAIRYTFNKSSGGLLLLGHVTTLSDKNQLLYNLGGLKFIKSIDDSGIVIDEYVWHEVNSILSDNPAWKGISIHSPAAGQFILSGYLQTRKQADQLSSYISLNFPYLDLLKKQIVVEEDVINQINLWLQNAQLFEVVPKMTNGEVTLTGTVPNDRVDEIKGIIGKIKQIPGVRIVNSVVKTQTTETGTVNISDHYKVTGKSRIGNRYTVVINGRILSENDELDGMTITKITTDRVLLESGGNKYRIDY
jgi:type III secretion system YscD/HrpQ family protein